MQARKDGRWVGWQQGRKGPGRCKPSQARCGQPGKLTSCHGASRKATSSPRRPKGLRSRPALAHMHPGRWLTSAKFLAENVPDQADAINEATQAAAAGGGAPCGQSQVATSPEQDSANGSLMLCRFCRGESLSNPPSELWALEQRWRGLGSFEGTSQQWPIRMRTCDPACTACARLSQELMPTQGCGRGKEWAASIAS
jgi:hypothetical protein